MTPRERVLAVLRGKPVDQVPFTIYEGKIPQCAVERRLRNEGLCIVNRHVPAIIRDAPSCVMESHTSQEKGKQRIRMIIRTPIGELSSVSEPAGFTSWTVEKLFKRQEDYKLLRCWVQDWQYRPNYEEFAAAEKWMGEDVILRGGVGACPLHEIMIHWMGVEVFAVEWMENRDEILALEALMAAKLREVYPILANSPITHANFGGNEVPEVMGPARYRQYCLPLFNACAEAFHAKGKWLGSHMDGNNRAWAADVAASGLDYIEAFTPAPDTDLTFSEALKAWPNKVLWINFPSSVHLCSLEKIRQTTREIIQAAAGTNRLILGITEDIPPDRWQENLLAISEVIHAMRTG